MTDCLKAWQCNGCGKIEAPQQCIGICQDRKIDLVYAFEHEAAVARLREAEQRAEALEAVLRQLAGTTPRAGEWERSYRALRERARRALSALPGVEPDVAAPDTVTSPSGTA